MKKYLIITTLPFLLSACNQAELAESNHQRDSLMTVVSERDASLDEFMVSFNDVERNLDSVAVQQHIITMSTDKPGELKPNQKVRINREIEAINTLMKQSRTKLSELSRKLKGSSRKNKELEKTIAILKAQIEQKDVELTSLNDKLNMLNAQVVQLQTNVTTLTEEGQEKSQTIADETMALHTAYYVVGKSKDLQNSKLIDRQGGLLGMGKTSKMNADVDNSKFTRIDYTQTKSIAVNSEMKMITSHPSDSYTLEADVKDKKMIRNIMIINPEKFWSTSKYLVVVKD